METRKESFFFFFFDKINARKIFCFHRVMVNGFQAISTGVVSCLFFKVHLYKINNPTFVGFKKLQISTRCYLICTILPQYSKPSQRALVHGNYKRL